MKDKSEAKDKPDEKDQEDWGFEQKKGGLSRETLIGLALILVVGAAFGIVYYKKVNQQKALLAAAAASPDDDSDDTPPASTAPKKDAAVAPAKNEAEASPFGDEPVQKTVAHAAPAGRASAKTKAPPLDDEPSDLFRPPVERKAAKAPPGPPAGNDNPFADEPLAAGSKGAPVQSLEPDEFEPAGLPPAARPKPRAAAAPVEDFEDPFAEPAPAKLARPGAPAPPDEFEPMEPPQANVAGHKVPPADDFGGFDEPPARATNAPPARATAPAGASPFDQPRTLPNPRAAQPAPHGIAGQRPPIAQPVEPGPGDFEPPVVTTPRARVPAAPFGTVGTPVATATTTIDNRPTVYEVQPNDNYWKISSKHYGTARYFQALAYYNSERVPDPTKLRPGMKVLTPPTQVLESSYPQLFPQKSGGVVAGETGNQPGLYLGKTGQPMYRIGTNDTLNTIARDHLGRSSRWIQIFEMNRDQLKTPNDLKVGTVLKLPLDASSVRMVQNGGTIR